MKYIKFKIIYLGIFLIFIYLAGILWDMRYLITDLYKDCNMFSNGEKKELIIDYFAKKYVNQSAVKLFINNINFNPLTNDNNIALLDEKRGWRCFLYFEDNLLIDKFEDYE